MKNKANKFTGQCTGCSKVKISQREHLINRPCRVCYPLPTREYPDNPRTWALGGVLNGWTVIEVLGQTQYNAKIIKISCVKCGHLDSCGVGNLKAHGRVCRGCVPRTTKPTVPHKIRESTRVMYEISDLGRRCLNCREWKTWEMFNQRLQTSTGYDPSCRACMRIYEANRRAKKLTTFK